ncbi:MAG: hypothetical protein MJ239_01860 [Bacilli bacterium]|nr:hypothetical protein [Bacilli bacterium]
MKGSIYEKTKNIVRFDGIFASLRVWRARLSGINKGYTVAVYAKKDASGVWNLTTDQIDQYGRAGFIATTDYGPHPEPVVVGEATKLNEIIKFSSWSYSFYMSDITAFK